MDPEEPDDMDRRLQRVRARAEKAQADRIAAVRAALDAGYGPSRIARHVGWTREYIAKIRDGKTGPNTH